MNTTFQQEFDDILKHRIHPNLQAQAQDLATVLMDFYEAQATSVFIRIGNYVICLGAHGYTVFLAGIASYREGEGLTGEVFKTKIAKCDNNFLHRKGGKGKYDFLKNNSEAPNNIMIAPLMRHGDVLGIIKVEDKKQSDTKDKKMLLKFTDEEFEDFKKKADEITDALSEKIFALQKVPFRNASNHKGIYPYCSLVWIALETHYYVGGIKRIATKDKNGDKCSLTTFASMYPETFKQDLENPKQEIIYYIYLPDYGTKDRNRNDITLLKDRGQVGEWVECETGSYGQYNNLGKITKFSMETLSVEVDVAVGPAINTTITVSIFKIRIPV